MRRSVFSPNRTGFTRRRICELRRNCASYRNYLQVIPMKGLQCGSKTDLRILCPSVIASSNDHAAVGPAQAHVISAVGINAPFFVCGADDQSYSAVLT